MAKGKFFFFLPSSNDVVGLALPGRKKKKKKKKARSLFRSAFSDGI